VFPGSFIFDMIRVRIFPVRQDASVGEDDESLGLCVTHHATSRRLLVFKLAEGGAFFPEERPNFEMAAWIG
jgi:hypothetical protein